jgi:8-oxo-dGTP diphosphatase
MSRYKCTFLLYDNSNCFLGAIFRDGEASNLVDYVRTVQNEVVERTLANVKPDASIHRHAIVAKALLHEHKEIIVDVPVVSADPRPGVAVFIIADNKILLGKRISKHENGLWGLPGGKLDYGETFEECVRREVYEETQLQLKSIRAIPIISNNVYKDSHYSCLWFVALPNVPKGWNGEVTFVERDSNGNPKCEGWSWFDPYYVVTNPAALPLMRGTREVLKSHPYLEAVNALMKDEHSPYELTILED